MSTDPSIDAAAPPDEDRGHYVVVARRYRPRSFTELVGQQQVAQALRNAIATNRVGHAYLFTGARGVGKTSTARILAKCLNCVRGPTAEPCGQCDACLSIAGGDDIDVLEIDGASNRGIDEIRQLRSNVNVRPSRSRFKVYIIDEVHMLTVQAFNALLKTLEEPPEHVKFIFCTTDPEKIPITVLSRCQRFDFAPVATESIVDRLRQIVASEGATAEDAALQILARRAGGSMRDSQSLLEQLLAFCGRKITEPDVHAMLGTAQGGRLATLVDCLLARNAAGALAELEQAVREGVDVGPLVEQLQGYFRDMMAALVGCPAELLLYTAAGDFEKLRAAGGQFGLATILAIVQILDHAVARMRQSTQTRTLVEVALVRICTLEKLDELATLIGQLRAAPGAPAAGGSPPAPRPPAAARAAPPPPPAARPAAPPAEPPRSAPGAQKKTGLAAEPPLVVTPSPSVSPPREERPPPPRTDELTGASAPHLWRQVMEELGGMTAEFGNDFRTLSLAAPGHLVVELRQAYNKEYCDRPEVKLKIEQTLSRGAGRPVRVEFRVAAAEAAARVPVDRREALQQQRRKMRDAEKNPLIQSAIQLFDAEVVQWDFKE